MLQAHKEPQFYLLLLLITLFILIAFKGSANLQYSLLVWFLSIFSDVMSSSDVINLPGIISALQQSECELICKMLQY